MTGVDGVEGLMKSLNLSEMEKKGEKLGWASGDQVGLIEPKAMGKFLSEKPAFAMVLPMRWRRFGALSEVLPVDL
jgi:hypothetical protein